MIQVQILSPDSIENQNKKTKKKRLHGHLSLYSAGTWNLFLLTGIFLSTHPAMISRWGGEALNLDFRIAYGLNLPKIGSITRFVSSLGLEEGR